MKPKISVILPVYNAEKYLAATLDSALSGTFSDFEIVAANDGSTDSSLSILKEYAERDARIKIIDKQNTGVSDTRNVAIEAAEGEYLAFLDSDDIYSPNYLERMYFAAEESGADVTVCGYTTFRGDAPAFSDSVGKEVRTTTTKELLDTGLMTPLWVKLVKKSIVVENGIKFDVTQKYSEDLFFSWKVCAIANRVCLLNDNLYGYRLTDSGATSKCYDNLYETYKSAIGDIREFLISHNLTDEIDNLNISFVRGLPAFLLMISRKKSSLKAKISEIKKILSDEIILSELSKNIDRLSTNKKDANMYLNAKRHRAYRLLMHGYYMDARSKLANLLKR